MAGSKVKTGRRSKRRSQLRLFLLREKNSGPPTLEGRRHIAFVQQYTSSKSVVVDVCMWIRRFLLYGTQEWLAFLHSCWN